MVRYIDLIVDNRDAIAAVVTLESYSQISHQTKRAAIADVDSVYVCEHDKYKIRRRIDRQRVWRACFLDT